MGGRGGGGSWALDMWGPSTERNKSFKKWKSQKAGPLKKQTNKKPLNKALKMTRTIFIVNVLANSLLRQYCRVPPLPAR